MNSKPLLGCCLVLVITACNSPPSSSIDNRPDALITFSTDAAPLSATDAVPSPADAAPGQGAQDANSSDDANGGDNPGFPELACTTDEILSIGQCALENCAEGGEFDIGQILTCTITSCFLEILQLSPECRECLLGLSTGGFEACTGSADVRHWVLPPSTTPQQVE